MLGLKSGKSANNNFPCLSRSGTELLLEDVEFCSSCSRVSFALLLLAVFRLLFGVPFVNTEDDARFDAIVNSSGDPS